MNWAMVAAIIALAALICTLVVGAVNYGRTTERIDVTNARIEQVDGRVDRAEKSSAIRFEGMDATLIKHGEEIAETRGWRNGFENATIQALKARGT